MIELYNENNKDLMARLPNESIDVICIDPPYLYLKNQKLEREFDEQLFFSECKRLLTKNGFIVMFGRGTSFYRWNTILDDLGFVFKEEIVWDKKMVSNAINSLARFHETISIFSKNNQGLNSCYIAYEEYRAVDLKLIHSDLKRIKSALNNPQELFLLQKYLSNKNIVYDKDSSRGFNATIQGIKKDPSRAVTTLNQICEGMKEKSIISVKRDHYKTIHPTQKPVRLLERLLSLVIPDKPKNEIVVADFFGGSFSTMEAVFNMGIQGISCEIDKEYFEAGKKRIESLQPNLFSSEM